MQLNAFNLLKKNDNAPYIRSYSEHRGLIYTGTRRGTNCKGECVVSYIVITLTVIRYLQYAKTVCSVSNCLFLSFFLYKLYRSVAYFLVLQLGLGGHVNALNKV